MDGSAVAAVSQACTVSSSGNHSPPLCNLFPSLWLIQPSQGVQAASPLLFFLPLSPPLSLLSILILSPTSFFLTISSRCKLFQVKANNGPHLPSWIQTNVFVNHLQEICCSWKFTYLGKMFIRCSLLILYKFRYKETR